MVWLFEAIYSLIFFGDWDFLYKQIELNFRSIDQQMLDTKDYLSGTMPIRLDGLTKSTFREVCRADFLVTPMFNPFEICIYEIR